MQHEGAGAPPRVGLLGAGGQAREVRSYLPVGTEVFHAVDQRFLATVPEHDVPVDLARPSARDRETPVVAAVGAPGLRRRVVATWPGRRYASAVSPAAYVDASAEVGEGACLAPQAALSVGVTVGRHCQVNLGATLSHDCRLGDHVTVAPGAHLAGGVVVGDGAFVGIGAVVAARVVLAPGVVVGAGAVVLHDVDTENAVVVGVPARVVGVREGWLDEL